MKLRTTVVGAVGIVSTAIAIAMSGPMTTLAQDSFAPSDVLAVVGNANTSGVDWVGDSGTFGFTSTACAYVSDIDVPVENPQEAGTCSASVAPASGTFHNVICGTGDAEGTVATSGLTGGDAGETGSVNFVINFVGTVGLLTGSGSESDSGNAWAVGIVQLSSTSVTPPNPNAPNDGVCVTSFTITSVAAVFDDSIGLPTIPPII